MKLKLKKLILKLRMIIIVVTFQSNQQFADGINYFLYINIEFSKNIYVTAKMLHTSIM